MSVPYGTEMAPGGTGYGAVSSVNSETGTVVLTASEVGADAAGAAAAAVAGLMPTTQTFALATNNTYQTIQQWTVTGQTDDPLPPFGCIAGSRTYGTSPAIQGPAVWQGYNPALLSRQNTTGTHGSAGISYFADAGDTNSSGAHGIECNISWASPGYAAACAAFQMVAVDDSTGTVNTTIRCGNGTSGPYTSNITFENSSAATVFAIMSNANSNVAFEVPVLFNGGVSTFTFNTSGTSQWLLSNPSPYLYIEDLVNSRSACYFYPGATAAAAKVFINSTILAGSSVICASAALATTATDGFLYLPSCAGPPTGTPTAKTGTVPCVFDTTDGKLYFYTGSAWVGLAD